MLALPITQTARSQVPGARLTEVKGQDYQIVHRAIIAIVFRNTRLEISMNYTTDSP